MFRCKECGTEFDVKPDYCDCGNDTFDEIVEQVESVELPKEEPTLPKLENNNPFKFEQKISKEVVREEKVEKTPKKEKKQEPLIVFERPDLPQIKIEPISLTIFLICLILSFVIVFFVGNPDPNAQVKKEVEQQTINNNIPNIDKLWDNTKPTAQQVAETQVAEETQAEPVVEQELVQVENPVQKIISPQKTQTPKKVQTKNNSAVTLPMPKGSKPVNVGNTQPKSKPATTTKPQQASKTSTATQKPKAQTTAKTSSAPKTTTATSTNPQEMAYYKVALRNKIASKIDFTNILGDGTCVVSFKVSSSGQLTNRAFAKQSDNGMLNDEVYQAIMSTPTFKAPPTGYNGATMRLTVRMYGGQFEVSLN